VGFGFQNTATCFVDRLSDEYAAYIDLVQPVQVAVYEMKLGSALVMSSVFRKAFFSRLDLDDMDLVMVFSFKCLRYLCF
jgi:midasin